MIRTRIPVAACLAGVVATITTAAGAQSAGQHTTASHVAAGPVATRASPACGGERPVKPGGGRYTCTFSDDFSGRHLDASKWVVADTAISGFTTGSGDCYVDDPDNISVSGGALHLTSHVQRGEFTCRSPFGDFRTRQTAGSVVSWGTFSQTYGRFEFRAKFPQNATWDIDSALWLYPQTLTYGAWPNSGEIDVAEWFGPVYGNRVFPSVHYPGEDTAASSGRHCVVSSPTTRYHEYAVVWTPTVLSFYYDDDLCWEHAWTPDEPLIPPQPFDHAYTVVMTQTGGFHRPVGTTVRMDIDWVRVWR